MGVEQWSNGNDRGKPKYCRKNLTRCYFVHQNLTKTELGSNSDFKGEMPTTIHLIHSINCDY